MDQFRKTNKLTAPRKIQGALDRSCALEETIGEAMFDILISEIVV